MSLRFVESVYLEHHFLSCVNITQSKFSQEVYLYAHASWATVGILGNKRYATVTILPFTPHQFHPVTRWPLTLKGLSLLAFSRHSPNKSTGHSTSPSSSPQPGCRRISCHCHYESSFPFTTISDKALGQPFYMGSIWYVASLDIILENRENTILSLLFSILIKFLHDCFPRLHSLTWHENLFLNQTKPEMFVWQRS